MKRRSSVRIAAALGAAGAGAVAGYGAWVAAHWLRYGSARAPEPGEGDPLPDRFMPSYDVVERHAVRVDAPDATVLAAACELTWQGPLLTRAIIAARSWFLRAPPDRADLPQAMLPYLTSIGWRVLAEVPGREIVAGAVTQPWRGDVVFPLDGAEFARFAEPAYVKIAWTLRADPIGDARCVFRSETRVGD
ncbi:hypothetical protein [Vulcanimicrobium alpinum]|nr:hypothetical protein [Vulcanimicrobium alpinum]